MMVGNMIHHISVNTEKSLRWRLLSIHLLLSDLSPLMECFVPTRLVFAAQPVLLDNDLNMQPLSEASLHV